MHRIWTVTAALFFILSGHVLGEPARRPPAADKPILLVDGAMIETVKGELSWRLVESRPIPPADRPAPAVELPALVEDGNRDLLYGRPAGEARGAKARLVVATSRNGRQWTVEGPEALVIPPQVQGGFTPLVDDRPGVPKEQRFKALARSADGRLLAMAGGDGLRWALLSDEPVLTSDAADAFYGRNGAFWSEPDEAFVLFVSEQRDGRRVISRSTSRDFLHWTPPEPLQLNLDGEDIWSATVFPVRANPPLCVALLTRTPAGASSPADVCLATSRDGGRTFERRFPQAWIRPARGDTPWQAMVATVPRQFRQPWFHVPELFFYVGPQRRHVFQDRFIAAESGRYPLELVEKGDVPETPTEIVTGPFIVTGNALVLNGSTNSTGGLRAEFLDEQGNPIPGYTLRDFVPGAGYIWVTADPAARAAEMEKMRANLKAKGVHRVAVIYGDDEVLRAAWRYMTHGNPEGRERIQWWPDWDISPLEGRTVRLRILANGADLYGFQTLQTKPQEGTPVDEQVVP